MITVNTRQLIEAILEAEAYKLPDMSNGTSYLFDNLLGRLSSGEDMTLSDLDFGAFELEDVGAVNNLYLDVYEKNCYTAGVITSALRKTVPACRAAAYV